MKPIAILTGLLACTTLLSVVARRIRVSYPILLVIFGLAISWIPGLPHIELDPEIVFLVFLPPLLYSAAWMINNADLKRYSRSVGLLSVGLVLFTATITAIVTHALIPGFSWAEGFLLGAIIAPPDAIAASSVLQNLRTPRRINTVLEGESLINDATALVLYRFALAAILTGQFSAAQAGITFLISAMASVALGLAVGWLTQHVHLGLRNDPSTNAAVSIIIPYGVYLLAEEVHLSGVLAVVTTGLFLSWRDHRIFSERSRLRAYGVWETLTFLLNGLVFILIGLQLPAIVESLETASLGQAIGYAAVVAAAVIVARIVWMYPGAYGPRWISRRIREREPRPKEREVAVVAWAGMRGIVSLAAALALPATLPSGEPFPHRDLFLFLTFAVIFATLVVQGLSLPLLIRWLGVREEETEHQQERTIRRRMAHSAQRHLASSELVRSAPAPVRNQVRHDLLLRLKHLGASVDGSPAVEGASGMSSAEYFRALGRVQLEVLEAERRELIALRQQGDFSDELLRKLERELDLEGARLGSILRL